MQQIQKEIFLSRKNDLAKLDRVYYPPAVDVLLAREGIAIAVTGGGRAEGYPGGG